MASDVGYPKVESEWEVGRRATKFGESFTEPVGDVFPSIIAKFTFKNDLANLLEML